MTDRTLRVGDLSLRVRDEGPPDGPAVLLLHGFPDSAELWRHQIPALAAAGFRAVAVDQRGFGASDQPEGAAAYRMPNLVADALGVLDALGIDRAAVVGHDWGAAVAWATAAAAPDRVRRLAALSVGYPAGFWAAPAEQRQRSWYMLLFLLEGTAEEAVRAGGWAFVRGMRRQGADVDRVLADLARPGALTAALNWYRANIDPVAFVTGRVPRRPVRSIACPTLGVWSDGDTALTEEQMTASARFVAGPWRYERLAGVGHWIPLAAPDRLNALLLEFLGAA